MVTIADFIVRAKDIGLFEFYLPFLLVFALVYGLLLKSKIFGDGKSARSVNAIVSFVAAFFVMGYTPVGISLGTFFSQFFGGAATVLITALVFLMIIALFVPKPEEKFPGYIKYAAPIGALIVIGLVIQYGGLQIIFPGITSPTAPSIPISAEDLLIILFFIVLIIVIWWLVKGEGGGAPKV